MRQIGAIALGVWYSLVFSSGFSDSIRTITNEPFETGFGRHYVLAALAWLIGVGIAALLAGLASRTYPATIAILSSSPLPLLYALAFLAIGGKWLDYQLEPLIFGWKPNALGFVFILCILTLGIGTLGGIIAKSLLFTPEFENEISQIRGVLGIRWTHWLWIWIPSWIWAKVAGLALYVFWLGLATGWHWLFHPSLWFNWKWLLYGIFGIGFTVLPMGLLLEGVGNALDSLSSSSTTLHVTKGRKTVRFLGYGFGMAILGAGFSLQLGFWILSRLPIVAGKDLPWWILK